MTETELTVSDIAARLGVPWSPNLDSPPRHLLDEPEPQPGALTNYWFRPPEPRGGDAVDAAPRLARPYLDQKRNTAVSATPKEPEKPAKQEARTGPIPPDEWEAGRGARQERWLTAEPGAL